MPIDHWKWKDNNNYRSFYSEVPCCGSCKHFSRSVNSLAEGICLKAEFPHLNDCPSNQVEALCICDMYEKE